MLAGRLDMRLQFQAPYEIDNGAGTLTQGHAPQFEIAASVKYLRGGETVLSSRLEQIAPVIITVRACNDTRQIAGEWRAVDLRTGTVFQIKELPRVSENRGFFEMLAVSGVAG
jgi:head-tail adaptor